jgi:PAS domain S-box-containing protein
LLIVLFVLVALELATLLLMLGVQRRMTAAYARAAAMSIASDAREAGFDDLEELASRVNDEPSNVYVRHDVSGAHDRMTAASLRFYDLLENLRRRAVAESGRQDRKVVPGFDAAGALMHGMTEDGDATIVLINAGDTARAGDRMASSDRRFALLRSGLNQLEHEQREAQTRFALNQAREAQALRTMQNGVAVVVTFFLLVVAVFARRMSKELMSARERNRYLEALTSSEGELRALNARLTELVRKEELILNSTTDGIVGLDMSGRVTFLNLAAERLLGWSLEEIGSRPIHDLAHRGPCGGPCDKATCPATRTRQSGIVVSDAAGSVWRKDGSTFPIEYSSTPIMNEDGSQMGSVFTFRDTTERRAIERMKDEFISVVSHELRTPLTSVRGALGLLAGGLIEKSPAKGQRMMEIAVTNTDRLIRLINDILDLERIESGKVRLQRVSSSSTDLLRQAADVMKPIAEQASVVLAVVPSSLSSVWADPDRIVQTLTNLVSNAIKFSSPGSTVSMSAEDNGNQVTFRVRDAGRGIPAEKLTTIFERFQQVDASDSREKGGTGLGLAICRSIVRQHGSEIRVESTLGKGSEFSFSLPPFREQVQTSHEPSSAFRILVWTAVSGDRESLQRTLEKNHYEVQTVDSHAALLRALALFQPDLILLDSMTQVSGFETLAKLKDNPDTAPIPVVISNAIGANEPQMPTCLAGRVDGAADEKTLVETLEQALHDSGNRPRILIVEDDDDLARVITESLERHDIRVFRARDGRVAVELVLELMPDLLILDPVLPGLDGFGVIEALRGDDRLRHLPVIVYSTAETSARDKVRLKLGLRTTCR